MLVDRSIIKFIKRCIWLVFNMTVIYTVLSVLPQIVVSNWALWIVDGIYCCVIAIIVTGIMSFICYKNDLYRALAVMKKMIKR